LRWKKPSHNSFEKPLFWKGNHTGIATRT
jgi:hypothetical protein